MDKLKSESKSIKKLKKVLKKYSKDDLYKCLSSYPQTTGITVKDYLSKKK